MEKRARKTPPAETGSRADRRAMLGANLSFEAAEAYRLLRTNIAFSFPQDQESVCRVIGVTSTLRSEGKSLTTTNLAYTLAMDGKRVLLIDCDLRLPSVSKMLALNRRPGLSNVLVGLKSAGEAMQAYGSDIPFQVLTAGDIPPNPSELLGSRRMKALLEELKSAFDYILLDLPPVSAVADPLVISKLTDGMVVTVRQNLTDRRVLEETVRQLKFVGANILGFVFNGVEASGGGYRYRRYSRRYGYKYGYGYGYGQPHG